MNGNSVLFLDGSLAERSKAPASGAGPKGREFESRSCQFYLIQSLMQKIFCSVRAISRWHCVRVVKELDLNSNGLCPHRFEPCRCRFFSPPTAANVGYQTTTGVTALSVVQPNIAQLVERSTVETAGIEWSLVRFRVFGFFSSGRKISGSMLVKHLPRPGIEPGTSRSSV